VVRASKVADSTVTETAEDRVTALLDNGDEAAFEPAPGTATRTGEGPEASTAADRLAERDGGEAGGTAADPTDPTGDGATPEESPTTESAEAETDGGDPPEAVPDPDSGGDEAQATDDQTDWGDFA